MSISPSKTIEFNVPTSTVVDTLIWQYKNSTNLQDYINCIALELDELTKAIEDTINVRYLADAYGYQLDVIGEIVGIGRIFYGAAAIGYFGFYDEPQSKVPSIGDASDPTIGGIYKAYGQLTSNDLVLDDQSYRNVIYAKIIQNGTNCRINHVLTFIDYVVGDIVDTELTEPTPNHVEIFIKEDLNQTQRISISLTINMVKPAGVKLSLRDNRGVIDTNSTRIINANVVPSMLRRAA